ncbi:MAG: PLxRFG domain-containing protein [Candidatus Caldarchaeum sp.]
MAELEKQYLAKIEAAMAKGKTNEALEHEKEFRKLKQSPWRIVKTKIKVPGNPELTKDSIEWKMYKEIRDTMAESALDLLRSRVAHNWNEINKVFMRIESSTKEDLTLEERKGLVAIGNLYSMVLYYADMGSLKDPRASADKWRSITANMLAGIPVTKEDVDLFQKISELVLDEGTVEDINTIIKELGKKLSGTKGIEKELFRHIGVMADMLYTQLEEQDNAARTLYEGYIPLSRSGNWQVRVRFTTPDGSKILRAQTGFENMLPYFRVPGKGEAQALKQKVENLFEGRTFKVPVYVKGEGYKVVDAKIAVFAETARQTTVPSSKFDLHQFMRTLQSLNVEITENERQSIVEALAREGSMALRSLARDLIPGEGTKTVQYVSQYLEGVASIVARNQHRSELEGLFEDTSESIKMWNGDKEYYNQVKEVWETIKDNPLVSESYKRYAQRRFEEEHYRFVVKDSQANGNRYKDYAARLLSFLDSQRDVEFSDFASGDAASSIKTWTVVSQLGGSVATGTLNILALISNVAPALATYNSKRAFGGGYGIKAYTALANAIKEMAGAEKGKAEYYEEILSNPQKLEASGLTAMEAQYIQEQILSGRMDAAMFVALLGTARGKITSGAVRSFIDIFMAPFTYTEQVSRRATGLAAFRLKFNEISSAADERNLTTEDMYAEARDFANRLIDNTLGQYANYSIPSLFRGGVQQFIFMYKMFPVNSILLMSNLSRPGKILMLATLFMMAGVRGVPFGEDFIDILDTIAQRLLGMKIGSVEAEAVKLADSVLGPGAGRVLLRGVVDNMLGTTLSSRTELANIIPGTTVFLPGGDVGRELIDIGGPALSAFAGYIGTGGDVLRALASPLTGAPAKSFTDILRNSPVTVARAFGDTLAYMDSGAIVDKRGYIVSEEISTLALMMRPLGFYPSSATFSYDVARMTKRIGNYQRAISSEFRSEYVKARLSGNDAAAQRVLDRVRDWNEAAKGTGLEVPSFRANADRAVREARKPLIERLKKTTSKSVREKMEDITDNYIVGA